MTTASPTVPRVLVIDEGSKVVDVITLALESHGFVVAGVSTGREALARVRESQTDLVVLEIEPPELSGAEPDILRFEDLVLDDRRHEVTRGEHVVKLTATEFRLLRYLMLNPDRVLTRAQLLDHVWEYDFGGDGRVLETYISYLRKKLRPHGPPLIHTVRGCGYIFRAPRRSTI